MTIQFLGSLAAALLVSSLTFAQTQEAEQPAPVENRDSDLSLKPIPEILRRHLPILGQRHGVLVESVASGSETEKSGIRAGDVLVKAAGGPVVFGDSLGRLDPSEPIVVIRRGRTMVLGSPFRENRFPTSKFAPFGDPEMIFDLTPRRSVRRNAQRGDWGSAWDGWQHGVRRKWELGARKGDRGAASASSSAISSSEGDRALAVSRAGDQISLEMSIPGLSKDPIGFKGTAKEIEDQLRSSTLSDATRRQVRAVLREAQ